MRTLLAVTAAIAALCSASASASTANLASLNDVGSATMVGNDLQLTLANSSAGAAWENAAISTGTSFSATFGFSMVGQGFNGAMADGIGLVLQNQGTSVVGNGGSDIGYWGLNGVGSLIQTWNNNTAGISTNGVVQGLKAAPFDLGASQNVSGTETVTYNASTHVLSMTGTFLDNSTNTSYNVNDSASVDLSAKFGSNMYLGFVGGTGGSYADQRITSLSVSAVPEPESYAMLLAGLGLMGFIARRRKA